MLLSHKRTVLFTAADPYPEVGSGLVMDFAGLRTGGARPYARNGGVRADSPTGIAGWSYSRTGELLVPDGDGLMRAVAANDPGIDPGLVTGAGLPVYEATTNKCTNYNAAPGVLITPTDLTSFNAAAAAANLGVTAVGGDANTLFGVIDNTLNLMARGFGRLIAEGEMNGRTYVIQNAAGAVTGAIRVNGTVGNTNQHTFIALIRGGTGDLGSDGVARLSFAASADFRFLTQTVTPFSSGDRLRVGAFAGQNVEFALNDLREKAYFDGAPVIVSGASASRGAASPIITGLGALLTPPFSWWAWADLSAIDGQTRRLITFSDGTVNNFMAGYRGSGNNAGVSAISGGVAQTVPSVSGKTGARRLKIAGTIKADGTLEQAVDAVALASASITLPTAMSQIDIGKAANANNYLNSPLLVLGVVPGDVGPAQRLAWTS